MEQMIIKPIPVPRTGIVNKLKLNIAPGQADVYIEQTRWPRQSQNPNWRIEVTAIDGRYDPDTQKRMREACEQVARYFLDKWLKRTAPLLALESVTWSELVKLSTQKRYSVSSPYQQRGRRSRPGHAKRSVSSQIVHDLSDTPDDDDESGV